METMSFKLVPQAKSFAAGGRAAANVHKLPPLLLSLLFHLPLLLNDEWMMWQVAEASEPVAPSEVDACRPPALKRKLRSAKLDGSAFQEVLQQAGYEFAHHHLPAGFHILPGLACLA